MHSHYNAHIHTIPYICASNQQVCGTSMYMGPKTLRVGGTDKLPQDFERDTRYVGDDQVCFCVRMCLCFVCYCVCVCVCLPSANAMEMEKCLARGSFLFFLTGFCLWFMHRCLPLKLQHVSAS